MKKTVFCLTWAIIMAVGLSINSFAQESGSGEPDPEEMAEKQTDKLAKLLKLEDWQIFYVDSTLRHDYTAMYGEMKVYQMQRTTNSDIYISIQDKYMEKIDNKFKEVFNEEQWGKYLKNGAAKQQRDRQKRKEKAAKAAARILGDK